MADDFDTAFAQFASPETDKKPDEAAAGASDAGAAAAGGSDGGAGATDASAGGGSDPAAGSGGDGGAGGGAGDAGAAATGAEAKPAEAGSSDTGGSGANAGGGGDAGAAAAGGDAGAAAAKPADAGSAPAATDQGGAAPDADAILAGLKKLVGEAKPAEAAPAADAGASEKPIYNADETAFLAKYEEDWGDVSKGEALKRRAEYQQLLQHVFTQVANFVKPIQETAEALAQRTFTSDVTTAVPDYSDQLRADVIAWVKTQPTYLQVAYNHVITEGTVDEVKDLVDRYRTATGKAAPKPSGDGGAAPKPAEKGNELSEAAKQAAAALAPVDSKRSGVQAPSDPSNFDDAWKEAAGLG